MGLDLVVDQQQKIERHYRGFLYSLDPDRTVTLRSLITDIAAAKEILKAPWIDSDRLLSHLHSMGEYFDTICTHPRVPGYDGLGLFFLQSNDVEKDQEDFNSRMNKWESFRWMNEGIPPQAHYLHTHTNFYGDLDGTWRSRKRSIKTLGAFSSIMLRRRRHNSYSWDTKPTIVGHQVPHLPQLLSVSNVVATDYLSRLLVHDIGHGFTPIIDLNNEIVHNYMMIEAMNTVEIHSSDPWERYIHGECTDPFFFLDYEHYYQDLSPNLTSLQEKMIQQLDRWYISYDSRKHQEKHFEFEKGMTIDENKECVRKTISYCKENGLPLHTVPQFHSDRK